MKSTTDILIIDDSKAICSFLSNLLQQRCDRVDVAEDGAEARQKAADHAYDLIVIDLILPDVDGLTLLKEFRDASTTSTIVMLTGMGGIGSATEALRAGADGYIQKQNLSLEKNYEEFLITLEQAMEYRQGVAAQQELQEIKKDFYSMMTHDLRNPTSALTHVMELLLSDTSDPLSEPQRELVELGLSAARQTLDCINNCMDFSKIDAQRLQVLLAPCNLTDILQKSLEPFYVQVRCAEQHLNVQIPEEPLFGSFDGERLVSIFSNLLANAVKYTPSKGTITVTLKHSSNEATITVADSGMGIPPEAQANLFQKYSRAKGTKSIQGTGIGLYIVKTMTEAHGGRVELESEGIAGKGSRFIVTLPIYET